MLACLLAYLRGVGDGRGKGGYIRRVEVWSGWLFFLPQKLGLRRRRRRRRRIRRRRINKLPVLKGVSTSISISILDRSYKWLDFFGWGWCLCLVCCMFSIYLPFGEFFEEPSSPSIPLYLLIQLFNQTRRRIPTRRWRGSPE